MPSERASQEAVTMASRTPTVVHSPSGSAEVTRTRVTARVPARPSRMRTLKSTRPTSLSSGWRGARARRRAWSRAWTGPTPSPTARTRSPANARRAGASEASPASSLRTRQAPLAVDDQADGGLGDVAAVFLALDQDPVALQGEGGLEGAALAADQQ